MGRVVRFPHPQRHRIRRQRWGPDVGAAVLADDYRHRQIRRATVWVRSQPAGYTPESVAAAARRRFEVGNHPREKLAAAYQTAAAHRTRKAVTWLKQNDDWNTTETDQADTAAERFGLVPPYAESLVVEHRFAAIAAWVTNNLPDDLPTHQIDQRITQRWGNTHYAATARAEWHHRQQELQQQQERQEQQRPHRGRPGLSL